MQLLILLILLILQCATSSKESCTKNPGENLEWIPLGKINGIDTFKANLPDSGILAVRGKTVIHSHISNIMGTFCNVSLNLKWVDMLSKMEVHPLNGNVELVHQIYKMPFINSREFLITREFDYNSRKKEVTVHYESHLDPRFPIVKGMVRATSPFTHWIFTAIDKQNTQVELSTAVDAGGSVPQWIVNQLQINFPSKSILGLEKITQQNLAEPLKNLVNWV